ncbi:MAG TPA: glycosyltransferase family 1 protein [Chloroflexota bacterium]|nr:glycosyltransferase family 1 protein [Chloroflexota bacterium]
MGPRVGFDATAAVRQAAGIGRYTRHLLRALIDRDDDLRYRVFYAAAGARHGRLPPGIPARALPLSDRLLNLVWHRWQLPLPVQALIGPFDLFHSPDFTLPPVAARPTVLTVHDLAFFREPDCAYPTLRHYLQHVVPRSIRRATRVIAVSESTRRDVLDLVDIAPDRVVTVHEAVDARFRPKPVEEARSAARRAGIGERYILSVGTLEPRKNYERLIDAFSMLVSRGVSQRLVIAGGFGWMYGPILERIEHLGLGERVTILQPDDDLLVALYNAADVFVYPSLYEGFGIPALEALACGAPVVASRTSSLPEVVGEAAILVEPRSIEDIASGIERVLASDDLRVRLSKCGPERARDFTWEEAADATAAVYLDALGG